VFGELKRCAHGSARGADGERCRDRSCGALRFEGATAEQAVAQRALARAHLAYL
jgi:hypothetical protein